MTQPITSITRGPRQSNFELLRIIAMFMVLTIHADFLTFGNPNAEEIATSPWCAFGRIFVESAAIIGVNIFIMISGWFGIKASLKGFCNFLFQVVYFYAISLLATNLMGLNTLSIENLARVFCIAQNGWFVTSYMILYMLSPVLNYFLNNAPRKIQRNFLISFFILQTIYGFIGSSGDFNLGYSAMSFIGLYSLAGYIHKNEIDIRASHGGGNCLAISIISNCANIIHRASLNNPNLSLFKSFAYRVCTRSGSAIQAIQNRHKQNHKFHRSIGVWRLSAT